jgi:serine protease Do
MNKTLAAALTGALFGLASSVTAIFVLAPAPATEQPQAEEANNGKQINTAAANFLAQAPIPALDFTAAAEITMPAVVHIKASQFRKNQRQGQRHPLEEFFWPNQPPQRMPEVRVGTGSGVIISADGYIVTNNHVIDRATEIEISLNDNRSYKAEVIGTDPSTDLALLKIEETGLAYLEFGKSDLVKVGQWVLAVGNPFNLNSTVTAGIISAKGRNINILRDKYAIESFLQTDAAINPGNSGGALVDLNGYLIGINTAIASPTGSYSGYGFAVPSEIARKVTADLKEYGIVQRGFIGVMIASVNAELEKAEGLKVKEGVYVSQVMDNGAAKAAGIQKGDVITQINGSNVSTSSQLQELIGRARPGDTLEIIADRFGKTQAFDVVLTNKSGQAELASKTNTGLLNELGIELAELSADEKAGLGLSGGVKVTGISGGKIGRFTDMRPGFIITSIDKKNIGSIDELIKALEGKKGGVMIEGRYSTQGSTHYYAFGM